jgi:hypothetical protein
MKITGKESISKMIWTRQLVRKEVNDTLRITGKFIFNLKNYSIVAALGYPMPQSHGYSAEMTDVYFFKLLCPQGITGLIIGRGGAIINQLNSSTGARIKLSQNTEFFPGTNDRILSSMFTSSCSIISILSTNCEFISFNLIFCKIIFSLWI